MVLLIFVEKNPYFFAFFDSWFLNFKYHVYFLILNIMFDIQVARTNWHSLSNVYVHHYQ